MEDLIKTLQANLRRNKTYVQSKLQVERRRYRNWSIAIKENQTHIVGFAKIIGVTSARDFKQ